MAFGYSYVKLDENKICTEIISMSVQPIHDGDLSYKRLSPNGLLEHPRTYQSCVPKKGFRFDEESWSFVNPLDLEEQRQQVISAIKAESGAIIERNQFRVDKFRQQRDLMKLGMLDETSEKAWQIKGFFQSIRNQSNVFEANLAKCKTEAEIEAFTWMYDLAPTVPTPVFRVITRKAFIQRFTPTEYKAILQSTEAAVMQLADVLKTAEYIELDIKETIDAIGALIALNLVPADKKAVILATNIEADAFDEGF